MIEPDREETIVEEFFAVITIFMVIVLMLGL